MYASTPSLVGPRNVLTNAKEGAEMAFNAASRRLKSTTNKASKRAIGATRDLVIHLPGIASPDIPAPPVPDLLQSNLPPTEPQAVLVSAVLLQAETQRRRLEAKLSPDGKLNRSGGWAALAKHKLEVVAEFIRVHRAVLSPFRLLPSDIIQEIFHWFTYPRPPDKEWRSIPWILGHICRSWRDVALSSSFLWYLIPPVVLDKRSLSRRHALNELFIRAVDRPLTLDIHSSSRNYDYPLMDVLIRHSKKWHFVKFNVPLSFFPTLRAIEGRLPNLRRLVIVCRPSESNQADVEERATTLDIFKVAPLLQEVSIDGMIPPRMTLPFSQLRRYNHAMTWAIPSGHVFASPILESLTLLGLAGDLIVPSVTLHHLVRLHLSSHNRTDISFLDYLTLPAIEELKLDSFRGDVLRALTSMISRSSVECRIKTLCVRGGPFDQGGISNLLQLTPGLLNLDISVPSATDINNMASGHEGKPLVPLLRTCSFFIGNMSAETTQALRFLASSRCEALAYSEPQNDHFIEGELRPIKTLRVYFEDLSLQAINLNLWDPIALQAALEEWAPSPIATELRNLRRRLHATFSVQNTGHDKKWFDKIDGLLSAIESVDIADARDIYLSEIHLSLERLTKMKILNDLAPDISNRARAILSKWDSLFNQCLKDRHWAFQGVNSIVYVPSDRVLRDSPDALGIVYGLPGKGHTGGVGDVFWSND